MSIISAREKILLYSLLGFTIGIIFIFILYLIVFQSINTPFTFQGISDLHKKSFIFIFADLIPLIFLITAYIITANFQKLQLKNEEQLKAEHIKRTEALQVARKLIDGVFTKSPSKKDHDNELLKALDELRDTLVRNKEEEQLSIRDDKRRNWVSEGLAMFGEILRTQEDNMEALAYKLISNLVKYLKANQGGFFLVEEKEKGGKYLQMVACYAYDRKKFADKTLEWGEGVIGTCALEKKTIYMVDIPENYLLITSGLGKANPNILVVVPLLVNDEVEGIMEIASFTKFEKYQVDFIEKVAESIAMTLSNIKGNLRTARLLRETQAQAEELAIQEEKVRQNIEELKATQEQAAIQAERFINFTNSVNHTMIRAEYNKDGYLLYANTKFLKKLGYSGNREVEGKHISMFIDVKDQEWFNQIWEGLSRGGKHFEGYMKHITRQGQDLWTMATYTCIRQDESTVDKILFLAIDTTEHKKQSLDFEGQMAALNRLNLKSEYGPEGKFLSGNELFMNVLKYTEKELAQKTFFDFLDRKEIESFNEIWEQIITGSPYQGQLKLLSKYEEEKWFRVSLSSVNDMYNEVAKVIFIANEITNEKMMEMEARKHTQQLKQQEEKLRLASMELTRKMEEKNAEWVKELTAKENEKHLFYDILFQQENIAFTVSDLGILCFLSKAAEKYWGIKSRIAVGKMALEVFNNGLNFPEPLINLIDPAKTKNFKPARLQVPDASNDLNLFNVKFLTTEIAGNVYYTASFNPSE